MGRSLSLRGWVSDNCYGRDLAKRALAHTVKDQVEAGCHRTDLLEQRRVMMEARGAHRERLTAQPETLRDVSILSAGIALG